MTACQGFRSIAATTRNLILLSLTLYQLTFTATAHKHKPFHSRKSRHILKRQYGSVPLAVTNECDDTIYPAIQSQSGSGPEVTGFELQSGESRWQMVSADWQGRIWGRTNCTFDDNGSGTRAYGRACLSGDCGGNVECVGTVSTRSEKRISWHIGVWISNLLT